MSCTVERNLKGASLLRTAAAIWMLEEPESPPRRPSSSQFFDKDIPKGRNQNASTQKYKAKELIQRMLLAL
jgi:hypothetical protein